MPAGISDNAGETATKNVSICRVEIQRSLQMSTDEPVRTAVGRVLRAAGYQVSLYESAGQLLENLPAPVRGCILLDVQMPGLNGLQLQEMLGKMSFELPIIFLSGHGDIPTSVRTLSL